MNETKKEQERVVIFAVQLKSMDDFQFQESLAETVSLSETAGLEVAGTYVQNRERSDAKTYLGKGRIEEVMEQVEREDITFDVVIVNDELTTSQSRHLSDLFDTKIIDRTQLILDIFAQRAKSREGQLQVELAQNEYLLPRLSGHGVSLSRLGGGIGTRGPGETKLETNRRHIRSRIHDIKGQLEEIKAHRQRYREQRKKSQVYQVALVGYTNAGKSSWFNQLTQSETYEENLLFATLDPKSKVMQINEGFKVILSDTVGFIQQLPTHLIEAFSSTLEEAKYADILIHVVDRSHPNYEGHIKTVNNLLSSLDMAAIPTVTLLNKSDLVTEEMQEETHDTLVVSSRNQEDIGRVKQFVSRFIQRQMTPYHFNVDSDQGRAISQLKEETMVTAIDYDEARDVYRMTGFERPGSGTVSRIMKTEKSETTDE
ncbi:GTPase HflX [Macrococcus equipercicus]|uniref:GTPase HflX n=1 Tax=Macrococcus equipercicus TaxID=69967 RepID=A0A9Q9BS66_9STAP|nr:GTPase HflX [Macrococcus equipercicus]UTH14731.1 GTPase HflX [Macrococcus equipercicus]